MLGGGPQLSPSSKESNATENFRENHLRRERERKGESETGMTIIESQVRADYPLPRFEQHRLEENIRVQPCESQTLCKL